MRPVNLIPPEERIGERIPMRTGPLPYIVIGAMSVVLLAVGVLVLSGNSINDYQAQKVTLQDRKQAAIDRSETYKSYAQFRDIQSKRVETVSALARSRFDWDRVLRELALVIPDDVWMVKMTASAGPGVAVPEDVGLPLRDEVTGPALEIVGCGRTHEANASFISRLKEIDGVTRVVISKSERKDDTETASAPEGGGADAGEECRTKSYIAKFEIVVAFDEIVVDPAQPGVAPEQSDPGTESRKEINQGAADADKAKKVLPGQ
ncbi:MAG: PilN domain-containing protein [Solirubrobacterales bacterium]